MKAEISESSDSDEEEEKKNLSERSEHLSENAMEDKRSQILLSKEEAEHMMFKKIF